MGELLRIGTRRSALAQAQTRAVIAALRAIDTDLRLEPVLLRAAGDETRSGPGVGDFTDRIDQAVESGEVDAAVHSAKDLPVRPTRAVTIAAYPPRLDPTDCLVLRGPGGLADLPAGARLGTSSVRRRALLRWARPDISCVDVRGNVDSRLDRMAPLGLDGLVLATCGLLRLGLDDRIAERLPPRRFVPPPGQGALAVCVRPEDTATRRLARKLDDPSTRAAVEGEQAVARAIGGDCTVPFGAWGEIRDGELRLVATLFAGSSAVPAYAERSGPPESAVPLGTELGQWLKESPASPGTRR